MEITYFLRDDGACGHYRVDLPLLTIGRKTDINVHRIVKGDGANVIADKLGGDVFVIPRPNEAEMLESIKQFQSHGKKIVIDYDDNMFNISPMSPHYLEWGTENVELDVHGKKVKLWEDGKNIDLKANNARLDNVKRALEMADMVTVTTDVLARAYDKFNDNVQILPNCVDLNIWKRLNIKRENTDEVRLVWAGGSSHFEDWAMASSAVKEVMNKYSHAKLVLLGAKFDGTLKGIRDEQIEFHPWVPTPAHPYKMAILNGDISIVPLLENDFSVCKSAIKWIEQGALQTPSVASGGSPYIEMNQDGNGFFIENNSHAGWVDGLSRLIEDPMLRWNMGGKAYKTVEQNFDINKKYTEWVETYQTLLEG